MSSEELSLTWGDHHSTLVGVFEKLLETSTLVDCTIAAEGQYLRAHKVVLSACSPYFELLFTQENEKNPIVILKDVKFQELKSMIDFIYRGKVKIPEDRLEDFIDAAESLQIKGLGGGQKTDDSETKENELQLAQKREGLMLHVPRKRRRLSVEDSENRSSPKTDINSESNSCESLPTQQDSADVLSLSQPEIPPPIVTLTTDSDVISPDVQNEQSNSEVITPSVPVECTLSSTDTERLLAHAASVVKTEPEPDAEIFLDDSECFVDPKKEVCVEEMSGMESDGISAVMEYVQQQQTTNQYSGAGPTTTETGRIPTEINSQPFAGGNATRAEPSVSTRRRRSLVPPSSRSRASKQKTAAVREVPSRGSVASFSEPSVSTRQGASSFRRSSTTRVAASGGAADEALHIVFESVGRTTGNFWRSSPSKSAAGFSGAGAVGTSRQQGSGYPKNSPRGFSNNVNTAARKASSLPSTSGIGTPRLAMGIREDRVAARRVANMLRPKRHVCSECSKAFGSPKDLRRHFRTHTFERPFVCEQCGKAYTQAHNLRKHNLKIHWNMACRVVETPRQIRTERDPLE